MRMKSSEKVPANGRMVEGQTSVNEAMFTGESRPVEKSDGDEVIAGSVNGTGAVIVEVEKTGEESYLNEVIGLVREAQQSESRTQDLANTRPRAATCSCPPPRASRRSPGRASRRGWTGRPCVSSVPAPCRKKGSPFPP